MLFLILFTFWYLLGENEKYLVFYRVLGGKSPWFYAMVVSWLVLAVYILLVRIVRITQHFRS
jgi:hypothetical protein